MTAEDREFLQTIMDYAEEVMPDIDPQKTKVRDVMSDHVIAVSPETDSLKAMSLMGQEQIRRLPVCEQGKLVGMISLGDFAQTYSMEASEALTNISSDTQKR